MFLLSIGDYLNGALTALGLSVDSFCATAVDAVNLKTKHKWVMVTVICAVFAIFHFVMPTIGYFIGAPFMDTISPYVSWISFAILVFLGLKGLVSVFTEWHVSREEAIGEKYGFEARKHILELDESGYSIEEIKRILKAQADSMEKGELPADWCGCGNLETPEQMKDLSRYLKHLALWISKKKLKEMKEPVDETKKAHRNVWTILSTVVVQAFATSLDALAVGFTYAASGIAYSEAWQIFIIFTAVVFCMCMLGGVLGRFLGEKSQRWANIAGSLVLIGLGIKALF